MKATLGVGLDILQFGLSENEVLKKLGQASKTYETDSGCRRLQYNDLAIELSFEPDQGQLLGWIEVHNAEAMLLGHQLVGCSEAEVMKLVEVELGQPSEIHDYGSFHSALFEDVWLELCFHFGRLENFNFGVLFDASEAPQWPASDK